VATLDTMIPSWLSVWMMTFNVITLWLKQSQWISTTPVLGILLDPSLQEGVMTAFQYKR